MGIRTRILRRLQRHLPHKSFVNEGDVYFTRAALLRSAVVNVFIHEFETPDRYPEFHDHPFPWGITIPLSGGYTEQTLDDSGAVWTREVRPGMIGIMGTTYKHRVSKVQPDCWTLFIAGPFSRSQSWGFFDTRGNFTPWLPFLTSRDSAGGMGSPE